MATQKRKVAAAESSRTTTQEPIAGTARAFGLHLAMVLLLLAISTAIVLWMPIQIPAIQVFLWVPVVYVLFVAGHIVWVRRDQRTTRRKP